MGKGSAGTQGAKLSYKYGDVGLLTLCERTGHGPPSEQPTGEAMALGKAVLQWSSTAFYSGRPEAQPCREHRGRTVPKSCCLVCGASARQSLFVPGPRSPLLCSKIHCHPPSPNAVANQTTPFSQAGLTINFFEILLFHEPRTIRRTFGRQASNHHVAQECKSFLPLTQLTTMSVPS